MARAVWGGDLTFPQTQSVASGGCDWAKGRAGIWHNLSFLPWRKLSGYPVRKAQGQYKPRGLFASCSFITGVFSSVAAQGKLAATSN